MIAFRYKILLPILALFLSGLACNFILGDDTPDDNQVVATLTPAPTSEPTSTVVLGETYTAEEKGFSFSRVPGWSVDIDFGLVFHEAPDANSDTGPAMLLFGDLYAEDITLDTIYNDFVIDFEIEEDGDIILGQVFDTVVAGKPARTVEIAGEASDGTPMAGQITVVQVSSRQSFGIFGASTASRWFSEILPYYNAVLSSLAFFEPQVEEAVIDPLNADGTLSQWGFIAIASSEFSDGNWSAMQATGEPDIHPACGDLAQAWAPAEAGSTDFIEIFYAQPVIPTEINIYQTYNPGYVIAVDVVGIDGSVYTVYNELPAPGEACNAILELRPDIGSVIESIVIYVDTTDLGDWSEIDAVELVGYP